jgi:16S rRNA (cytosine967-C5)-methyltransferase
MTPAARLQATIDLLVNMASAPTAAEVAVSSYFRRRRYAGAKDRRAVTGRFFDLLRRRRRLEWWIARAAADGGGAQGRDSDPRRVLIADLCLSDGLGLDGVRALFNGSLYAPPPLTAEEESLARSLAGRTFGHADMPAPVALEYPSWLDASLRRLFGDSLAAEMSALNRPAPVDLRANSLKGGRDAAAAALVRDGIETEPTPFSPVGLRLGGRANLAAAAAYRDGLVEVQDEGSQLIALLTAAAAGMTVVDFCAGGGGKALALAAAMANQGRVIAADVSENRMRKMIPRLRRSGAAIVETRLLAETDAWPVENQAIAERLLLDMPCSGSGAWRRDPEAKWRLSRDDVTRFAEQQRRILAAAHRLTKVGGRLVYATCSLLEEENEEQMIWFLETHPGFTLLSVADVWAETLPGRCPAAGPYLRLSPAATGTDGFFIAIFQRRHE